MTTREKVIIGMMCATIAYGAYELISSGKGKIQPLPETKIPTEELRSLVADISQKLSVKESGRSDPYALEMAGANWTRDPFIQSTEPLAAKPEPQSVTTKPALPEQAGMNLVFSGFMQVGQVKLAIINGIEYAEGEALGTSGYYVRGISAHSVVVASVNGSDTIRLLLQE